MSFCTYIRAEKNYSSAHATVHELPKSLLAIPSDKVLTYFMHFHRLVGTIGIRVIGFGLAHLLGLYEKYDLGRAHGFNETSALIAERYRALAGQDFLERKTSTAREALEHSSP
jgi:hypothetical protein